MNTILIVEDEERVRKLLKQILTHEYQVREAAEANEAIKLARSSRPDLVILDLNLQGYQDGLEVCRALRSDSAPVLAQVPILMLTGSTKETDIKAALAAGATGYIGKPYNKQALLASIATLLAAKSV